MIFRLPLMMLLGCVAFILLIGCEKETSSKANVPEVLYLPLKSEEAVLKRTYPGRVVAAEIAEIRPQAGGILLERLFEVGDEVKAGQVLYRIDDAPFKAAWEEAKARLEKAQSREKAARKNMERCINLAKNHAVPIRERDDAIAAYNEVEAEIKAARDQLLAAAHKSPDLFNVRNGGLDDIFQYKVNIDVESARLTA